MILTLTGAQATVTITGLRDRDNNDLVISSANSPLNLLEFYDQEDIQGVASVIQAEIDAGNLQATNQEGDPIPDVEQVASDPLNLEAVAFTGSYDDLKDKPEGLAKYKGTLDAGSGVLPTSAEVGDFYLIVGGGDNFGNITGDDDLSSGDMIQYLNIEGDNDPSNPQNWAPLQRNDDDDGTVQFVSDILGAQAVQDADILQNQVDIGILQSSVGSNDSDISALQSENTTQQSEIDQNEADITALENQNTTQQTEIDNLEAENTTQQSEIDQNESDINTIETQQTAQDAAIGQNASDIAGIDDDDVDAFSINASKELVIDMKNGEQFVVPLPREKQYTQLSGRFEIDNDDDWASWSDQNFGPSLQDWDQDLGRAATPNGWWEGLGLLFPVGATLKRMIVKLRANSTNVTTIETFVRVHDVDLFAGDDIDNDAEIGAVDIMDGNLTIDLSAGAKDATAMQAFEIPLGDYTFTNVGDLHLFMRSTPNSTNGNRQLRCTIYIEWELPA